jgi:hypothetical protein
LNISQKVLLEVHHEKGSSKGDYVIFKMISIPPFKFLIDKQKKRIKKYLFNKISILKWVL